MAMTQLPMKICNLIPNKGQISWRSGRTLVQQHTIRATSHIVCNLTPNKGQISWRSGRTLVQQHTIRHIVCIMFRAKFLQQQRLQHGSFQITELTRHLPRNAFHNANTVHALFKAQLLLQSRCNNHPFLAAVLEAGSRIALTTDY